MGISTQLKLLLTTLAGLFLMVLPSEAAPAASSFIIPHLVLSENTGEISLSIGHLEATTFAETGNAGEAVVYVTAAHIKNQFVSYKKKFKRWRPAFSGFKVPAKAVASVAYSDSLKNNYIKPDFLSHLHNFLFRLTPF